MNGRWGYTFRSVTGTSHLARCTPCQDASACAIVLDAREQEVLIAAVADGAGSATHSEIGSEATCASLVEAVTTLLSKGGIVSDLDRSWARGWLTELQLLLRAQAEKRELTSRDVMCTVSAAVVGPDAAMFLQVGDGLIVVSPQSEPDEYSWVFWPHRGEYANETVFVTEARVLEVFDHEVVPGRIDEVSLLTDGLERLALHLSSETVFAPFFQPMFAAVRDVGPGYSQSLAENLFAFLSSPRVNDRTSDDKTILLASRYPTLVFPPCVDLYESEKDCERHGL